MAQQEPVRVVVEKRGGCFSGCGTAFGVLLLIGLAIKYWYVALSILVLVVAVGAIANSQQKQKAKEAARRRSGPRDPWLNEVAVALADLGFNEVARNTGNQLGGAPMEGDIGLQADTLLVYVNLFANADLARQAEIGLRAQQDIRTSLAGGHTALRTAGPVLYVANARGGVVDEFRVEEVVHTVGEIPLPPALGAASSTPLRPRSPTVGVAPPTVPAPPSEPTPDALEQIRKLAELRDTGLLTDIEFEAKKAELLRRI